VGHRHVHLVDHDLLVDIQGDDALDRADVRDHTAGVAVSSSTRAAVVAAWRAAESGR
jgi:hypothetical protein